MRRILKTKLKQIISKLLLVIFIVGYGLASCTYHTNDYDPLDVPDNVSFDADIIPIFEARCNDAGCHSGAIPPDLQREVAYKNLINGGYVTDITAAENNILYQKIDGGSMEAFATDLDRAFIKKWIEEGALDN
ncbi:MAG: hypothetical protein KAQ79_11185 [Cyclobacteriaceae bacterium]|nr:hypothetical protein [Cyclobacteriaceae bacterium]MCK5278294.1 hypothetical protein [Cyclobacteriaceae bacterium]